MSEPANRKANSGEGRIGGPCHSVKADGFYCPRPAVIVATDGWGYCSRHAPRTAAAFGRTETWHSGWRGKRSSTDVRTGIEVVGVIEGTEMPAIAGAMEYRLRLWGAGHNVNESADSLRAAKARARDLLRGHEATS